MCCLYIKTTRMRVRNEHNIVQDYMSNVVLKKTMISTMCTFQHIVPFQGQNALPSSPDFAPFTGLFSSFVGSLNPSPDHHDDRFTPSPSVSPGFRRLQARFVSCPSPILSSNETEKNVKNMMRKSAMPSSVFTDTSMLKNGMTTVLTIG